MNADIQHSEDFRNSPWGLWATVGFGLIVVLVFFIVQFMVLIGFIVAKVAMNPDTNVEALAEILQFNGFLLGLSTCASAVFCIGLILLWVNIRKGPSVKRYLALNPIAPSVLFKWLGVLVIFILVSDGITYLLGRAIVPEFMILAYETAYFIPLLWFAIVVAAPLFEEIFFRGFLFAGFQSSRLGNTGAILLTSLAWTVIHLQYEIYELSIVFVLGIILGIARLMSQSLYVPIAIHAFANLLATIELVIYVGMSGNGI